ncbi:MAG TPA: AtpZ/AtpI family protein [Deltaproteobacteria bacterium]|nr:AtpZ/AtpI family protein [Deltaproteobacteria bacterium]HOM28207.1 AtpZ/AtpI family protein [Deltaproteobacteria bacterium]HPP81010.1 AtpZ/AtpI family protein [Deltaproteobacteria bacterium]
MKKFTDEVVKKEKRRIRGLRQQDKTVWFGLGMFGVVGWSVAIPTLIGVAIGLWIDQRWPSQYSWALMLLILGVMVGCLNAWYWVRKGGIEKDEDSDGTGGPS